MRVRDRGNERRKREKEQGIERERAKKEKDRGPRGKEKGKRNVYTIKGAIVIT